MDSSIAAAARALRAGDPLGALKRVALRDDPPALALRGIAVAQLGEHARARELFRRAVRGFGASDEIARARCVVAEAEVALAMRDLRSSSKDLDRAGETLAARGDQSNAIFARLLAVRRLILLGRVADAGAALAKVELDGAPPVLVAIASLATAELALRQARAAPAREAFERAHHASKAARIDALSAEIEKATAALTKPAARLVRGAERHQLKLDEVEALLASPALVVDATRRVVACRGVVRSLRRRPVLFELLRTLAEATPSDVSREELILRAFGARRVNESHRVRLRVELGRLRRQLDGMALIDSTPRGFSLVVDDERAAVVLEPPIDGQDASLLALLADGEAWSTSALALALGRSQRSVQRALADLENAGEVRSIGKARARRWLTPSSSEFTTSLLLPLVGSAGY
ncbi:MAG: helix-turn-helix domain-containing protein [Polyangiaceae bacterium]|nr:helix-turn-helix domain-containing protein [Polyangiaceae bacterium]